MLSYFTENNIRGLKMAPRKGLSPFARVISSDLPSEKKWYVLSNTICSKSPSQYFKKSVVVSTFPDEFKQVEMESLRLVNGDSYRGKCSDLETVASSFGLLAVILRQQHEKSAFQKDGLLDRLQEFLNDIDLSVIFTDEEVREADERPRAARRLAMPSSPVPQNASDDGEIAGTVEVLKTPTSNSKFKVLHDPSKTRSPNLQEICENSDLDTPEKALMCEKRGKLVISDINEVCDRHRESLSTVLSYLCAFGNEEARAVLNEVAERVSVKRGVKRAVEELVGDETYSRYVESMRVPDWVLLYFKTKARISGNTWQAVLNITRLGRTGVSETTL